MRNLLLFLQRHYVFVSFLILFAISFFILVNFNRYQRSAFIHSANVVTGNIYKVSAGISSYFNLRIENEALHQENSQLKSLMREMYYVDTISAVYVNDSFYRQRYEYIPARVINNSIDKKYNYITLDKGSIHGVQRNQGVICSDGVVGVVVKVSERFSTVMSVLNRKTSIPPKVDSMVYYGSIKWDGSSYQTVQLTEINQFAPVQIGQKVYTSGYSGHYPESIPIGTIERINLKEGSNFYDIDVKLSTDFSRLTSVYIVQNLFKEQIFDLEEETGKEDQDVR